MSIPKGDGGGPLYKKSMKTTGIGVESGVIEVEEFNSGIQHAGCHSSSPGRILDLPKVPGELFFY